MRAHWYAGSVQNSGALTFPGGELKEPLQQFPIGGVIKYGQYQSARW